MNRPDTSVVVGFTLVLSGGFLAAWFLWRRDLAANIAAHVVVDSFGLIFAPSGA